MREAKQQQRLHSVPMLDRVSKIFFPVLFLFLNCLYWVCALMHDYDVVLK